MKIFKILVVIFVSGFFLTMTTFQSALDQEVDKREGTILYSIMGILDYLHFDPKKVDDDFSKKLWANYIEELDGGKRFFTQKDINALKKYELDIDNEIDAFSFDFFDKTDELFVQSIDRAERTIQTLLQTDLDLKTSESFELDSKKRVFPKDEIALIDSWRQFLKYSMVAKIDAYMDDVALADSLSLDEMQIKAHADLQKLMDDWFVRLKEGRRSDRFESFMNVIMGNFDPHSTYFSPKEKVNFDIQMGNKLEGIGARLEKSGDFVKISSIIPGGPAWKGKDLEPDDLILSVKQENMPVVDITGMRIDDVISMIRGKKGTKVILRVKRLNGTIKDITIERDEVILDDAAAKSMVLTIDNISSKVGYIHLPIFYSTFDGANSCASDIKKELLKLKDEGVNGVILDLRYNGGGSLPDVIDMAGLFIEKGPIVQVKARDQKPEILEDKDVSVTYNGPLIVMVNEVSASASEILAAALQDYNRAIIVGGQKTFGKASVQGIYDLDRMITGENAIKPLGEVKLTTQKFFRIDGTSNQLKGVVPDIYLPDQFSFIEYGEDLLPSALSYSEISNVNFTQNVYQVKALDVLRKQSMDRVSKDARFSKMMEYGAILQSKEDDTVIDIGLDGFVSEKDNEDEMMKPYDQLFEESVEGVLFKNLAADENQFKNDEAKQAKNLDFINGLTKDFYLKEAVLIMNDMIENDKKLAQK